MPQLRGKVVLVDFWTYSCINCQRTLPHVEAWYKDYAKDGFVVVGVHTPEFNFEHVVSNVKSQAASLGVKYPVAIDNNYKTWDAYDNEYWPADYLIDAQGDVRHVSFGEGGYSDTEGLIRQLLTAAHPGLVLPPGTDVANKTPTGEMSPETYVGYQEEQYIVNPSLTENAPAVYQAPVVGAPRRAGAVGDLDRGCPRGHRRDRRRAATRLSRQRRVPRHGRVGDGARLDQRQAHHDHPGRRSAQALHAVPGVLADHRQPVALRAAWYPGLRLHLRLTVVTQLAPGVDFDQGTCRFDLGRAVSLPHRSQRRVQ